MVKKRDTPCPKDGWPYPGFHICLDLSNPIYRKVEDGLLRDSEGQIVPQRAPQTATHREKIGFALRQKAALDPKRIERNKRIIELYNDERLSIKRISEKLEISTGTVRNVLKVAASQDLVILRYYNQPSDVAVDAA